MPPNVTASTGMDAVTQLIEPLTSSKANPITDALCREGLVSAAHSLQEAYIHGEDLIARQDMSIASLLGGIALANAKLGVVHGFASVLGGMYKRATEQFVHAYYRLLLILNIKAMKSRDPTE